MSEQASGESDTCREIAWSDSKPDGAYCLEKQKHIAIGPSIHVLGLTCTWPIHSLDMEACWKGSQNVMSIYKARVLVKTGRPHTCTMSDDACQVPERVSNLSTGTMLCFTLGVVDMVDLSLPINIGLDLATRRAQPTVGSE